MHKRAERPEVKSATQEQLEEFNQCIAKEWASAAGYVGLTQCITAAAQHALPTRAPEVRKPWITSSTWQLMLRKQREGDGMGPAARDILRKETKRSARKDKRAWLVERTEADSPEHRWKAPPNLKREYAPSQWERTNQQGAPVPKHQKAADAERYMAT